MRGARLLTVRNYELFRQPIQSIRGYSIFSKWTSQSVNGNVTTDVERDNVIHITDKSVNIDTRNRRDRSDDDDDISNPISPINPLSPSHPINMHPSGGNESGSWWGGLFSWGDWDDSGDSGDGGD